MEASGAIIPSSTVRMFQYDAFSENPPSLPSRILFYFIKFYLINDK